VTPPSVTVSLAVEGGGPQAWCVCSRSTEESRLLAELERPGIDDEILVAIDRVRQQLRANRSRYGDADLGLGRAA